MDYETSAFAKAEKVAMQLGILPLFDMLEETVKRVEALELGKIESGIKLGEKVSDLASRLEALELAHKPVVLPYDEVAKRFGLNAEDLAPDELRWLSSGDEDEDNEVVADFLANHQKHVYLEESLEALRLAQFAQKGLQADEDEAQEMVALTPTYNQVARHDDYVFVQLGDEFLTCKVVKSSEYKSPTHFNIIKP